MASKLVVITGASSGIGEATAKRYGVSGARVAVLARSADRLAAVAQSIHKAGGDARPYVIDLSDSRATEETAGGAAVLVDPLSVESIAAGIEEAAGRRDELVAAGLARARPFTWAHAADAVEALWRELE